MAGDDGRFSAFLVIEVSAQSILLLEGVVAEFLN
jgi:hypothetical protein